MIFTGAPRRCPIGILCSTFYSRVTITPYRRSMQKHVMQSPILAPLIALVLWTFVMWAWMYATRIPAIWKYKVALDPYRSKEEFNAQLPAEVRWKADNYNHLMEQPTLFYAVALTLAFLDAGAGWNSFLAWAYVGLIPAPII